MEDIIKQKHGEADRGRKVSTNRWSQSAGYSTRLWLTLVFGHNLS